jgi:hypothetical protein
MKLKLGKLPSNVTVRMTVVVPEILKQQLDRYAKLHSRTWGQNLSTEQLVSAILCQFLASDATFQREERLVTDKEEQEKSIDEILHRGA